MPHVRGPFDVDITPLPPTETPSGREVPWAPGQMALAKRYHGALEGTGEGRMMAVRTEQAGSAGYVAMERVSGTLDGRTGTFVLQHSGVMDRAAQQLSVVVIPDSGTGELLGLRGRMDIVITDGKHEYVLDYELG